ncbi:MAG TPA: HDOD domain-containing protein [Candidatus Hydrogenedentes bacterium]|nr:HDOD domain-containing protein [Candidatus Hydrogenedentota bacterium]
MSENTGVIRVACPCGHKGNVPSEAMGKPYQCPKCGERFTIAPERLADAPPVAGEAAPPRDPRVGQLLVQAGLITEAQLAEALSAQADRGGKLFEVLINLAFLSKADLHTFLSGQPGVTAIELRNYDIPYDLPPIIPAELARKHVLLPIDRMGKLLTVGMACPLDASAIAEVEKATGLRVKAMLCSFDDIHAALERFYPAEKAETTMEQPIDIKPPPQKRALNPEDVLARLDTLDVLPILSSTLRHVHDTVARSGHTIRDVAGVVCTDPALSAALVGLANSSVYGMPGRVASINLAVTILGETATVRLAENAETVPPVPVASHFDVKMFWLRSVFAAAASMALAKAAGCEHVGEAYTAGLLHEIGRLALAIIAPDATGTMSPGRSQADLLQAEQETYGVTHPEAAYRLAQRWSLPPLIAAPIHCHHAPDTAPQNHRDLCMIVAAAAALAGAFPAETPDKDTMDACAAPLAHLGMSQSAAMDIYEKTSLRLRGAAGKG